VPSALRQLSLDDVREAVGEPFWFPGSPCLVGVELEWLTFTEGDHSSRPDNSVLAALLGPLPAGSAVTFEPGGQLELSSLPFPDVAATCAAAGADLAAARRAADAAGVRLVGMGADPVRPSTRVLSSPRYDAMEAYFDAAGPAGRRMMANTAAVQVNVGLGPTPADARRQWRLASHLGPTMAAAFASSPLLYGRPTGFRSTRLATWWAMDASRTAPVDPIGDDDGPDAWAAYALAARVMLVRTDSRGFVPLVTPLTLAQWVAEGHELGRPTLDDVRYHLSTLFPPVRPRSGVDSGGWLELRMIDALPDPWWQVPVAVFATLLGDAEAGAAAERAVAGTAHLWVEAARNGLASPELAASAAACFDAALAGLAHTPGADGLADLVAAYADRWVRRGRCPADDHLEAWARTGTLLPEPAEVGTWA